MKRVLLVPGSHNWRGAPVIGAWWWPGSPFARYINERGLELIGAHRPFVWTTDVNGVLGNNDRMDWRAGGENLYAYLVPPLCEDRRVPPEETLVIAHSHGLQVALYAAAAGLKIHRLVSVCSPVRTDTEPVAREARANIGRWLHIYESGFDIWQLLGGMFDGQVALRRTQPLADVNDAAANIGHSDILKSPALFPLWEEHGWLRHLLE